MHLLVIEDDPRLVRLLRRLLEEDRHVVETATTGRDGVDIVEATTGIDAIILDIGLPDMSGLDVARKIRATGSETAILMLTARDTVGDRVNGLDAGADDYLVKPFAFEEFLARVRALVRRRYEEKSSVVTVGDLVVDGVARRAAFRGVALDLTAREYALLEYLALRRGHTVLREEIEDHIYGVNKLPSSNAVDSAICILRAKFGPEGRDLIRTKRGQGYVLEDPAA